MSTHLIAGCGYLGRRVADRWLAAGESVKSLTRSRERAGELSAIGIEPIVADVTQPDTLAGLPAADVVLFAVGFDRKAGCEIQEVYVDGLRHFLNALPQPPRRFIYISSTGVFGQTDGGWVNEQSPCEPARAGGKACLAAERLLLEGEFADRVVILRCAGLYGPARIPRAQDIESGEPIAAHPDVWLNLIHIDDAADLVVRVAAADVPSRLYLVSDGNPVQRRGFYEHLTKLKGLPEPQFNPPASDDSGRRAGGDNKRIDNRRMMEELKPTLNYPSYREGLAAIET